MIHSSIFEEMYLNVEETSRNMIMKMINLTKYVMASADTDDTIEVQ